jgi:hypothetical protein
MGLLSKAAAGSSAPAFEDVSFAEISGSGGPDFSFDPIDVTELYITEPDTFEEPGIGLLGRITKDFAQIPSSPLEKAVMDTLNSSYAKFGSLQGIVLEALKYTAGEFSGRLGSLISGFAVFQGLAPGRCLALFSASLDGELIARHLAKTVPGNAVFTFRAEDPQGAFILLKPYL